MNDLSALSTDTLQAMKSRLTNWIVYIAGVDVVLVGVFAWFAATRSLTLVLPFVPVIMLPTIAMVPFLLRAGAIRRELDKRRA